MPGKESQLTSDELNSLRLSRLIFHVFDPRKADEKLTCLDIEVPLGTDTYAPFFEDRLRAASRGTQFVFVGEHRATRDLCAELISEPTQFVHISKQLAEAFSSHHRGRQMAAGVIIIAVAHVQVDHGELPMVFILKMDHRPALTYKLSGDAGDITAQVQHIADALVEDRAAVQRSALVDVSDRFAWDVLASERNESSAPELRLFFRAFLSVEARESASVLTRKAVVAVGDWARKLSDEDRPEEENWRRYRERATQYMKDHAEFDSDEFMSMVVRDDDPDRRSRVIASLREALTEKGVEGQRFDTKANSLPNDVRKTRLVTAEGVTIVYEGDRETHRIEVLPDPEHGADAQKIVIRTRAITEKS